MNDIIMNDKGIWIYDIESFSNFFSYCAINRDTEEKVFFYIHGDINQLQELKEHLHNVKVMIGFNNISYDYPIIHKLLTSKKRFTAEAIYNISQQVIKEKWSSIPEWNTLITQIDLFLINHYNNKARSSSLKWLEFTTRWNTLQDLPYNHYDTITIDMIPTIKDYNFNDVFMTKKLYEDHCKKAIAFRKRMMVKLDHNVLNYSDVKIGEFLNRKSYEKLSGRDYREFKDSRTYHDKFELKDILPKDIEFETDVFNQFYDSIKDEHFYSNQEFDRYIKLPNITIKFAKGGLHSEDIPRIVENTKGYLVELDIGSMYPWTIVSDNIYPRHLGPEWNESIKNAYFYRANTLKPKLKKLKKGSEEYEIINSEQEAYKLSLNGGGFGKLGDKYSWQHDELAKYKVTIGGEIKMLKLIEWLYLAGIELVSVNTDGVVVHFDEFQKAELEKIWKKWEKLTTYTLEDTYYSKIIFSSVNDYIAEIIDKDTKKVLYHKYKGDFEIDKDPHKNNSQRIVPIALKEYFINNIPLDKVIGKIGYEFINSKGEKEKTTIYDYCIGRKKARDQAYHYVEKNRTTELRDKVIRYYIVDGYYSQNKIFKEYRGGKKGQKAKANGTKALEAINKGFNHMLFMNYESKDDYHIDTLYYKQECHKIINVIETNTRILKAPKIVQTKLF